ncbi:XrtA/PEP-CTERM system-associated ATPase [Geobacter sulfurreducens]|uniref:XrtA/PEP-CTERM system-associated ATPase n=1 Tax=Geobacter sulfurreducens TaxID=35554 RepID=UPI000022E7E8|nr:XrtA/PEP-CTERM system-associated ATPase [Geobacter sulfurreducens]
MKARIMYEAYFNLTTKPFELLPNPDFIFPSKSHKRALMYLDYGISERAGFILLTGDIGTGKTTLIRNMIQLKDERTIISRIFNTRVEPEQLLAMICHDFGIPAEGRGKVALLNELNDYLIEQFALGNRPVLIIDEAQNLSADLLEDIRLLSNLETSDTKLLQIVLVGQPELREVLALPQLLQLRQRISINCHISPLSREETEGYIFHRLDRAGNRNAVAFSSDALDIVYRYSRGIPRLVNIICDFILLSAFAEQTTEIPGEMVRDIIGDLDFENHYWGGAEVAASERAPEAARLAPGRSDEATELVATLRAVIDRLESLEGDFARMSRGVLDEMSEKVASLENAFRFHVDETDSHISEIRRRIEKVQNLEVGTTGECQPQDSPKGLLKRMFGA